MRSRLLDFTAAALMAALPATAYAIPYASALSDNGVNYSFVLNQDANLVEVSLDGGAFTSLGALSAGSHTFALGGASSYNIRVTHSEAEGWTQYSDDDKTDNVFFRATGVSINKNPGSSNFGTIYVTNPGDGEAIIDPDFLTSRFTFTGIYSLQADTTTLVEAALGNIDFTQSTTASPLRTTVAPDNQVYIADWSDANPGVWRAPADLSGTWTQVLANNNPNPDGSGLHDNHGSIRSVYVEGTGAGTVLYTMDEDLDRDEQSPGSGTYWVSGDVNRYDIGENLSPFAGTPTLAAEDGALNPSFDPGGNIVNSTTDFVRDEDGSWWVSQFRFDDGPGGLSVLNHFADGGTEPLWQSGSKPENDLNEGFGNLAIDNGLDIIAVGTRGSSDLGIWIVDISNPDDPLIWGQVLNDSDGLLGERIDDVDFDAAGNLYLVSRGSERLKIFSPGGDSVVTTGSDGSFIRDLSIDFSVATPLQGDLDGDGFVGIADLNIILSNWNEEPPDVAAADPTGDGFVGIEDLNVVLSNWNAGTPPAADAVPEPATLALLGLGGLAMLQRRR